MSEITTGFLSKHLGDSRNLNENNTGLGYISPTGLILGAYLNSLNKPSVYAAKEMKTEPYSVGPAKLRAGLLAGAVTGYKKPLSLLLLPEVTGSVDDHTLALGIVPPMKGIAPATLALQYRKKF